MYVMIPYEVLEARDISDSEYRVLSSLLSYAHGRKKTCFPSQGSIADMIGKKRSTVNEALSSLKKKGYITWDKTNKLDGKTCTYKILFNKEGYLRAPSYVEGERAVGFDIRKKSHKDEPVEENNNYSFPKESFSDLKTSDSAELVSLSSMIEEENDTPVIKPKRGKKRKVAFEKEDRQLSDDFEATIDEDVFTRAGRGVKPEKAEKEPEVSETVSICPLSSPNELEPTDDVTEIAGIQFSQNTRIAKLYRSYMKLEPRKRNWKHIEIEYLRQWQLSYKELNAVPWPTFSTIYRNESGHTDKTGAKFSGQMRRLFDAHGYEYLMNYVVFCVKMWPYFCKDFKKLKLSKYPNIVQIISYFREFYICYEQNSFDVVKNDEDRPTGKVDSNITWEVDPETEAEHQRVCALF